MKGSTPSPRSSGEAERIGPAPVLLERLIRREDVIMAEREQVALAALQRVTKHARGGDEAIPLLCGCSRTARPLGIGISAAAQAVLSQAMGAFAKLFAANPAS